MKQQIKDTKKRNYVVKEAYWDEEGRLVTEDKEGLIEIDLINDLKSYFGTSLFNITVAAQTESVPDPEDVDNAMLDGLDTDVDLTTGEIL